MQLYQHSARWTRTISAKGRTWTSEIATFHAMDTHDLCRGLHFEIRNRNFTSISRDGHARSPQRVALWNQKAQLYMHSVRWTRTIPAEGCTSSKSENTTLRAFRAIGAHDLRRRLHFEIRTQLYLRSARSTRTISAEGSHFETMLQKHGACHEIMSQCCTGHAKTSSTPDSLHLPRKLTFLASTFGFLAPAMRNEVHVRKRNAFEIAISATEALCEPAQSKSI